MLGLSVKLCFMAEGTLFFSFLFHPASFSVIFLHLFLFLSSSSSSLISSSSNLPYCNLLFLYLPSFPPFSCVCSIPLIWYSSMFFPPYLFLSLVFLFCIFLLVILFILPSFCDIHSFSLHLLVIDLFLYPFLSSLSSLVPSNIFIHRVIGRQRGVGNKQYPFQSSWI